jgi:hypothetical protein
LRQALDKHAKGTPLLFLIRRDNAEHYVTVAA